MSSNKNKRVDGVWEDATFLEVKKVNYQSKETRDDEYEKRKKFPVIVKIAQNNTSCAYK